MYRLVIYYGKETQSVVRPDLTHVPRVVLTLVEPLSHKGYDLYTDRFYTSPVLAPELQQVNSNLVKVCFHCFLR